MLDVSRGNAVADEKDPQLVSGAAGVATCIGADFAKVNYPAEFEGMTRPESLAIASQAAGQTGIICSGGGSLPLKIPTTTLGSNEYWGVAERLPAEISIKGTQDTVKIIAVATQFCESASVDEALKIYNS